MILAQITAENGYQWLSGLAGVSVIFGGIIAGAAGLKIIFSKKPTLEERVKDCEEEIHELRATVVMKSDIAKIEADIRAINRDTSDSKVVVGKVESDIAFVKALLIEMRGAKE